MKRVLILESNEAFAAELSDCFSQAGHVVCGVTGDGTEGLALLEKVAPDLVVVSLLLTGVDGFTVMERARKEGVKADFIVLGNFADDKIIGRAIALFRDEGVDGERFADTVARLGFEEVEKRLLS